MSTRIAWLALTLAGVTLAISDAHSWAWAVWGICLGAALAAEVSNRNRRVGNGR